MTLSSPSAKHIRFDIDKDRLKGECISLRYCLYAEAQIGTRNSKQYWAGLRWRLSYLDNTDDEVIGYLGENKALVFDIGNKEDDLPVLQKFACDAYFNVQVYIYACIKDLVQFPAIPYPDMVKLGCKLSNCLDKLGAYQ